MSGHKRRFVSISEAEYRRLHEAEMKLRSNKERSLASTAAIREENEQALWDQIRQTQARQRMINESLDDMGGNLRQIEDENCRLMTMLESELYHTLQNSNDDLLGEAQQLVERWTATINDQMMVIERRLEGGFAQVRIEAESSERDRQTAAQEWLETASQYLSALDELYDLDLRAPEEYAHLYAQIRQAEDNARQGFAEAAITNAQQVYLDASKLRMQLERRDQELAFYKNASQQQLQQLLALIEETEVCQAMDTSGQLLPVQINIDYWTSGNLGRLREEVLSLWDWTERCEETELLQLKEWLVGRFPGIKARLDDLIFQARWEAISSQLRINIADIAVQALEEQGFDLVDAGYSDQDQRGGYTARVLDYAGSQVQIYVEPLPGTGTGNELHIFSGDAEARTEHELVRRDGEISKALGAHGLIVRAERSSVEQSHQINESRSARYEATDRQHLGYT
jgi:hypothetical protein